MKIERHASERTLIVSTSGHIDALHWLVLAFCFGQLHTHANTHTLTHTQADTRKKGTRKSKTHLESGQKRKPHVKK